MFIWQRDYSIENVLMWLYVPKNSHSASVYVCLYMVKETLM